MKTFLIAFLLGAFTGALTILVLNDRRAQPVAVPPATTTEPKAAPEPKGTFSDKLAEWHLTPAELKEDLAKGGEVVRSKARAAGEKIGDARIITVIKAKYVLDRDLSALAINIDVSDGVVTLTGTAGSAELIGRAIALALETDGVVRVVSKLTVG